MWALILQRVLGTKSMQTLTSFVIMNLDGNRMSLVQSFLFLNILCAQRSIIVFTLPTPHFWVCFVNFLWSCLLKSSRRPVLLRSTPWKLWMLFASLGCSRKWWIWPSLKAILKPLALWTMLRSVVHPVRFWMPVTLMQSPNSMSGMLWAFHQHRRLLWCPLALLLELQPKLAFR